jgi:hypothetical protein
VVTAPLSTNNVLEGVRFDRGYKPSSKPSETAFNFGGGNGGAPMSMSSKSLPGFPTPVGNEEAPVIRAQVQEKRFDNTRIKPLPRSPRYVQPKAETQEEEITEVKVFRRQVPKFVNIKSCLKNKEQP